MKKLTAKLIYLLWVIYMGLIGLLGCKKGVQCDYVGRVNGIEVSRVYEFTMDNKKCWKTDTINDTTFQTECEN